MLSLKRAAWSFRVLPGDVVILRSTIRRPIFLNRLHAGLRLAASSDIFHLPHSPLSHRYRAWVVGIVGKREDEGGGDVDLSLGLRKVFLR